MEEGVHTARTRRRDVLPAFCNPIMVTSISVALPTTRKRQYGAGLACQRDDDGLQVIMVDGRAV